MSTLLLLMNHLSLFSLRLLAFTSVSNLASESWTIPFSDFSCDFWDNRSANHLEAGHLVLLTLNGLFWLVCNARKLICLNDNERDRLFSFVFLMYVSRVHVCSLYIQNNHCKSFPKEVISLGARSCNATTGWRNLCGIPVRWRLCPWVNICRDPGFNMV